MAEKAMMLKIMPSEIMGTEIVKNGDYRYASIGVKKSDNEHLRISYEWKGNDIPEFVMDLMDFMKAHEEEINEHKNDAEFSAMKGRM